MTRSLEQNDCLHKWCREIRDHLNASGAKLTEETVKELILLGLGNVREVGAGSLKEKVAMRSHRYKRTRGELTAAEVRAGMISMDELLEKVVAWCATDLNLDLLAEEAV